MKGLFSNPNIAPHIRESLKGYAEQNHLHRFYTSYYYYKESYLNRCFARYFPSVNSELQRRYVEEVPESLIKSRPIPELVRVLSSRKLSGPLTDKIWEWGELGFDYWVSQKLHGDIDWVHTSEHAGLKTLLKAKELGIMSIHEQPSLHHRFFSQIVQRQTALFPEFALGTTRLLQDQNSVRRNRRRDEELRIADYILCNSKFTKKTLVDSGLDATKIITVPLGFPTVEGGPQRLTDGKLIFMYAGNIAFGKGIHLLLEAWKSLSPPAELWLVGNVHLPTAMLEGLPASIKFLPRLSHAELMKLYYETDVFVHPTLADGFGMVVAEAMSRGVPVITTYNSGAADLITEKQDGLVITPESIEAIIEAILWCIENKLQLPLMGSRAQEKARKYPWSAYRQHLIKTLLEKNAEWKERKRSA